jgi:hypothetical protein
LRALNFFQFVNNAVTMYNSSESRVGGIERRDRERRRKKMREVGREMGREDKPGVGVGGERVCETKI